MYARGCRCQDCKEAEANYSRARRIGQKPPTKLSALPTTDPDSPPAEPGKTEAAVIAELDGLPMTPGKLALAALALVLAKDLDTARLAASHAALSRELRSTLDALHQNTIGSGGTLALVSQMSRH
jgi:hypothetical protein